MARPVKEGLIFFALPCNFLNIPQMLRIREKYGNQSGYITVQLLGFILKQSYYIHWGPDELIEFATLIGVKSEGITAIIGELMAEDLLSKPMYEANHILTGGFIQYEWKKVQLLTKRKGRINPEYQVDVSSQETWYYTGSKKKSGTSSTKTANKRPGKTAVSTQETVITSQETADNSQFTGGTLADLTQKTEFVGKKPGITSESNTSNKEETARKQEFIPQNNTIIINNESISNNKNTPGFAVSSEITAVSYQETGSFGVDYSVNTEEIHEIRQKSSEPSVLSGNKHVVNWEETKDSSEETNKVTQKPATVYGDVELLTLQQCLDFYLKDRRFDMARPVLAKILGYEGDKGEEMIQFLQLWGDAYNIEMTQRGTNHMNIGQWSPHYANWTKDQCRKGKKALDLLLPIKNNTNGTNQQPAGSKSNKIGGISENKANSFIDMVTGQQGSE